MSDKLKLLQARVKADLWESVSEAASECEISTADWMRMVLKREAARTLRNKERQRVVKTMADTD